MKTIIFLLILLCLPFSVNWGQDLDIDQFDTVNAVVRVTTDTSYDWQMSYFKQQHRADSLEKELIHCKMYRDFYCKAAKTSKGELIIDLHDSIAVLSERLEECETKCDSTSFMGRIWGLENIVLLYEDSIAVLNEQLAECRSKWDTTLSYLCRDTTNISTGRKSTTVAINTNPLPFGKIFDTLWGYFLCSKNGIITDDSAILYIDTSNWPGEWREDTVWIFDWQSPTGKSIESIDTTWRPIVPGEGDK